MWRSNWTTPSLTWITKRLNLSLSNYPVEKTYSNHLYLIFFSFSHYPNFMIIDKGKNLDWLVQSMQYSRSHRALSVHLVLYSLDSELQILLMLGSKWPMKQLRPCGSFWPKNSKRVIFVFRHNLNINLGRIVHYFMIENMKLLIFVPAVNHSSKMENTASSC